MPARPGARRSILPAPRHRTVGLRWRGAQELVLKELGATGLATRAFALVDSAGVTARAVTLVELALDGLASFLLTLVGVTSFRLAVPRRFFPAGEFAAERGFAAKSGFAATGRFATAWGLPAESGFATAWGLPAERGFAAERGIASTGGFTSSGGFAATGGLAFAAAWGLGFGSTRRLASFRRAAP